AASAIAKIIGGKDRQFALREFARASAEMYWGRLLINRLARAAVLSPRIGSLFVRAARINPAILKLLTTKIVYPKKASYNSTALSRRVYKHFLQCVALGVAPLRLGYSNCRAAFTVFDISIAMVIGPTPAGTGVIAFAFFDTSSNATSPTRR